MTVTRSQQPRTPRVDLTDGWEPAAWLGAPAPGGLALPAAHPTPSSCYGPRGVYLDSEHLVVADSGNHRVLLWHGVPRRDRQPADVVLGQPDAFSEGPAAGGHGAGCGMHLPTGVLIHQGALLVADAWQHRILIWDQLPERTGQPPDRVLGQPDTSSVAPNRGGEPHATSLYWPFGIGVVAGRCYIADTGNRRVLGWRDGVPESADIPADLVLGQPDAAHRAENRGGEVGPASFRWPHAVSGEADLLLVADPGNHRVLGWRPVPQADRDADWLLGQADPHSAVEFPYGPQRGDRFRFPYSVALDAGRLAVADTANNRVLVWNAVPTTRTGTAGGLGGPDRCDGPGGCDGPGTVRDPDAVLGQHSLRDSGENRWSAVEADTLCWPYAVALHGDHLAIADSGNNRVMIWRQRQRGVVAVAVAVGAEED